MVGSYRIFIDHSNLDRALARAFGSRADLPFYRRFVPSLIALCRNRGFEQLAVYPIS
jgi:hypothetical protein